MSVYTIADLHLSTHEDTNKSMEVFGQRWQDYTNRIEKNWKNLVTESDTVIIGGDISDIRYGEKKKPLDNKKGK